MLAGLGRGRITNREPRPNPAEAGQSNYHQVQDNLYRITQDHNTGVTGDSKVNCYVSFLVSLLLDDIIFEKIDKIHTTNLRKLQKVRILSMKCFSLIVYFIVLKK